MHSLLPLFPARAKNDLLKINKKIENKNKKYSKINRCKRRGVDINIIVVIFCVLFSDDNINNNNNNIANLVHTSSHRLDGDPRDIRFYGRYFRLIQ